MNDSPAVIIAKWLQDEGLFTDPSDGLDWPVFIGSMPDGRNVDHNCAAVYDTSGVKDGRLMVGEGIYHPGIQVKIRSASYADGWDKAMSVENSAESVRGDSVTVGVVTYTLSNISQTGTINPLGEEKGQKRRYLFTLNFVLTVKEN